MLAACAASIRVLLWRAEASARHISSELGDGKRRLPRSPQTICAGPPPSCTLGGSQLTGLGKPGCCLSVPSCESARHCGVFVAVLCFSAALDLVIVKSLRAFPKRLLVPRQEHSFIT